MCKYLPHINNSFVDLHTEDVLSHYTILDTMEPHNGKHTMCSADSIVSSAVYRDRTSSVRKSIKELLVWGRYSHVDTSPHIPIRFQKQTFELLKYIFSELI
jgi:hypothetical protein